MQLKVVIEPDESGGFVAHVPALPGCWSQGEPCQEVLDNIREAAEGGLEAQQDKARDNPSGNAEVGLINL